MNVINSRSGRLIVLIGLGILGSVKEIAVLSDIVFQVREIIGV